MFNQSVTIRLIISDRLGRSGSAAAAASRAAVTCGGERNVSIGSLPVAGRPRFLGMSLIDGIRERVLHKMRAEQEAATPRPALTTGKEGPMPTAIETTTTSRRTFLVGMAAAAVPASVIPAAASGARTPFCAAVERYRKALAELNASPLEDEAFDAGMASIINPLEEAMSSMDLASPSDAVLAMDLARDRWGPLSQDNEAALLERIHEYLRRVAA